MHRLQGHFNQSYQPLGWLLADFGTERNFENYERSLDLLKAMARVRYEAHGDVFTRDAFVSFPTAHS